MGALRISSTVEKLRRPVGLPLNLPLPILFFPASGRPTALLVSDAGDALLRRGENPKKVILGGRRLDSRDRILSNLGEVSVIKGESKVIRGFFGISGQKG